MIADEIQALMDKLELTSQCIDVKPVDYDWGAHSGEWEIAGELTVCPKCKGDGSYDCDKCKDGDVVCPDCKGEQVDCKECDTSGNVACGVCDGVGEICENGFYRTCPECEGSGTDECPECGGDGHGTCETCDGEGTVDCEACDGYGDADCDYEGCESGTLEVWEPMMSYYYPLPRGFKPVPSNIHDQLDNCTLIWLNEEEQYVLALTGGGMDMTWQICSTFVKLGYLPPAHFCDLPRMAQYHGDEQKLIVAACLRSMKIQISDAKWRRDKLLQIQKDIEAGRL